MRLRSYILVLNFTVTNLKIFENGAVISKFRLLLFSFIFTFLKILRILNLQLSRSVIGASRRCEFLPNFDVRVGISVIFLFYLRGSG